MMLVRYNEAVELQWKRSLLNLLKLQSMFY